MHRATPLSSSFRGYTAGGTRSAVDSIDDSKLMQEHSGNFMHGESRKGVEAPQNYGFTSVAMGATKDGQGNITDSAEAMISFMGGNRSFPVAGVMDDRRHRLFGLQPGDSAMFRTRQDKLQFHLSSDGGFLTGPRDKTVRMQLLDEDSDQQQQGQQGAEPGQRDASSGAGGAGGQQGGQQQKGQKPRYKDAQKSYRFHDVTKDETRSSGTNVRSYLQDGKCYLDVNADKNVYHGAKKGDGAFDLVVTLSGPTKNVKGFPGMNAGSPAPDIRLVQDTRFPRYSVTIDWKLLGDGTLDDTQALATAIIVALGTNALADISEPLPDPDSTDRAGWWGDLDADVIWNAWPIGAKLWLLRRSAIESVASRQGSTVARVLAYVNLALQPFVDQKVASRFIAAAERVDKQRIDTKIVIYRGPIPVIELLYSILWDEQQSATQTAHN